LAYSSTLKMETKQPGSTEWHSVTFQMTMFLE
jgi:hypothetical protein